MRQKGVLAIGIIDKVYSGTKGGLNIDYHFYTKDDTVQGSEFYYISRSYIDDFKNKSFPVKYIPTNPAKNRMLILKSDFKEMNEKFPDSLTWVLSLQGL